MFKFLLLIQLKLLLAGAYQFFDETNQSKQDFLEATRPVFDFPASFEVGISSNDPGLNVTEIIYYDRPAKKIRMQLLYSILGLD